MAPRFPSLRSLREIHDADHAAMRRIGKMKRTELDATEAGAARNAECYHSPTTTDVRMHALNVAARTHGVEHLQSTRGEVAYYLNTGDTYAPTIIRWHGTYRVQAWGDFVETQERNGVRFE